MDMAALEVAIREALQSADPSESLLDSFMTLDITVDLFDIVETEVCLLLDDMPLGLTVDLLEQDFVEGKISDELYGIFLSILSEREENAAPEEELADEVLGSSVPAQTVTRPRQTKFKNLREFAQAALGFLDEETQSESALALMREFSEHPKFREFRRGLGSAALKNVFGREEEVADVPTRIGVIRILLGYRQAELVQSLFDLTRIVWQETGWRMGGHRGPTPHTRNQLNLVEEGRTLLQDVDPGEPLYDELTQALRTVEMALVFNRTVSFSQKQQIWDDWGRDRLDAELQMIREELDEFYELYPALAADIEAELEERIRQWAGIANLEPDARVKALYQLAQSSERHQARLGKLLGETIASDSIFNLDSPVDKLRQAITVAQLIHNVEKEICETANKPQKSFVERDPSLSFVIEFGDDTLKAHVFEIAAKMYDDRADDLETQAHQYKKRYHDDLPVKVSEQIAEYRSRARGYRSDVEELRGGTPEMSLDGPDDLFEEEPDHIETHAA